MTSAVRWIFPIVTGVIFIGIGCFFAFRPLWAPRDTLTGARWLDMAMAGACLLRGMFNIRAALLRRRSATTVE